MRTAALTILLLCGSVSAEPLGDAEVRLGYGVSLAGRGEMTSTKATPLTIAAIVAVRTSEEPPLAVYGGLIAETLDRTSAGAIAGIRLAPLSGRWRLSAGGVAIIAPATLWGPSASGGVCAHLTPAMRLCGDVQLTAYLGGDDLAEGQVVTHAQLVGAMVLDAF